MNLLEATSTLIDVAKTWQPEDLIVKRAVRRMEKRLDVLRLRQVKALRRRRHVAWEITKGAFDKGCCPECKLEIKFGDFVKIAVIAGNGFPRLFKCPVCDCVIL